jgi:C4-dicarboxylate-specific signal transduction histidine kinase
LQINEVILEVIALISREIEKNGISAQTQLSESLPAIQGDRVQLQQVILNLLINAIRGDDRNERGTAGIADQHRKERHWGSRFGAGPGLMPENVERLFESFYNTKPGGLGLACRSAVRSLKRMADACGRAPMNRGGPYFNSR